MKETYLNAPIEYVANLFPKDKIEEIHVFDEVRACVPWYTPITTKTSLKDINKIKVGDEVLTHTGEYHKVLGTINRLTNEPTITIIISTLGFLNTTRDHPYLTKNSWKRADELTEDDYVTVESKWGFDELSENKRLQLDYNNPQKGFLWAKILRISAGDIMLESVYNLLIDKDNSYVARHIVVHDCGAA